jgi:hypothetical protein
MPATAVAVCQPFGDLRRRVRGQVVQHDVYGQATRDGCIGLFEEAQHVGRGVTFCRPGWVRSSAWHWVFSSQLNTTLAAIDRVVQCVEQSAGCSCRVSRST